MLRLKPEQPVMPHGMGFLIEEHEDAVRRFGPLYWAGTRLYHIVLSRWPRPLGDQSLLGAAVTGIVSRPPPFGIGDFTFFTPTPPHTLPFWINFLI